MESKRLGVMLTLATSRDLSRVEKNVVSKATPETVSVGVA